MARWFFRLLIILFFLALVVIGIDITRRTTFPGSRPQLKERILRQMPQANDSVRWADSAEQR